MGAVLATIALTPSAPVLVPELAGTAADEVAQFREAACAAAALLPPRWVAVGVAGADRVLGPGSCGTFAGYGVDVAVTLSPADAAARPEPAEMPLCALFAGWLRAQANPAASVEVHAFAADLSPEAARERGRRLRADIDAIAEPVGLLVVADGANTLTPAAPGGYDPAAGAAQADLDDALAAGDAGALLHLPAGAVGRVAYQVLAGVAGGEVFTGRELVRGAPYGVGYFVGVWTPGTA